jgi:predicted HTH domain antitoxin
MSRFAVELPDDIARQLETEWHDMPRRMLEAIAVEAYRSGILSQGQVRRILNLSWHETEAFLKARQAYLHYDEGDLEHDVATLDRLLPK